MKNSNESIEMLVEKLKYGLRSAEKILNGADKQLVLEVGNHATKMVEFEVKRKTIQITNGFVINTPLKSIQDDKLVETNLLSRMLFQSIKQAKIKTKEFTVSIVSKEIIIREMDVPKMQEKELKGFLKINSKDIFPVNLANYVLGYNFIEKGEKNRIMIAAIPKAIIYPYIELGQKLGLTLKGVNYSGYELYNFLDYEIGIMHETYLAIDFGARNTNAIVIADGVLKFNKLIPKGLEQITEYICDELNCNVSRAEQLKRQYNVLNAREGLSSESEEYVVAKYTKRVIDHIMLDIVRIVEFYNANNPKSKITKLYIIGSIGKLKGIEEYFNEKLNLKTKTLKMLQKLDFKKNATQLKGRQMSFINCLGATNLQDRKFVFFRDDLEIKNRSFVLTSKFHKLMGCVIAVCILFIVSIVNDTNKLQEKIDEYQTYINANGEVLNKQKELETREKELAEINNKINSVGFGAESTIKLAQIVESVAAEMIEQAKIDIVSYDLANPITLTCKVDIPQVEGDNTDTLKYINLPYNFRDNVINKFNAEVTDKKYDIEVNKRSDSEFDIKIKEASNEK